MVLDGVYWKDAIARHREGVREDWVRRTLSAYRQRGITYLRDGGDRWGVCSLAARLAPEYGIRYRIPGAPIHKNGHYGGFIGRCFDTMADFRALVEDAKRSGADFIKIMISGLMDFDRLGVLTDVPLTPEEIREMIAIAHGEGFSVMAMRPLRRPSQRAWIPSSTAHILGRRRCTASQRAGRCGCRRS